MHCNGRGCACCSQSNTDQGCILGQVEGSQQNVKNESSFDWEGPQG